MKFGQSMKEQRLVFSNSVAKCIIDYKALKKSIGVMKKEEEKNKQNSMLEEWLKCFSAEMRKFDNHFQEAAEEIEEDMEEYVLFFTDINLIKKKKKKKKNHQQH